MREITSTGQTVEDAVKKALKELNVEQEQVDIRIIDEGKKGLFGIFGQKPAIVHVKLKETSELTGALLKWNENTDLNPLDEAKNFLEQVIKEMGITASVDIKLEEKTAYFNIKGENLAILIGKRGQTLNSLQYLTQLVANKTSTDYVPIILDAENYREKRRETLTQLAVKLADKVVKTNKEFSLEPMPSFERKIIHSTLMEDERVQTYSVGTEPNRYVVIAPK
ncbi:MULTISPECIES: RNA-binding cell elongation regulator Jag/EloR [Aeribacillus]|uniref:RNA-binding protein KhpB n=1 Tax=Aeribacillus pallidus TaxID=33936 RepID=A0A165XZT6_9BACI|nr:MULTISPECIES: RNA-binding cell elongation regulator Jag/EloR [Aeribacillus]KZM52789.1 protein jag [Aeribacillus pallidus]KZN96572.1 protein jag [Aeribacillus pallidus]MED0650749.1 RNA-binding cell elongation regulator Jag/EloR [Aeribacillus composti]MED0715282.1 RNA-binding cell elongation regulator Jag/EloR [Aeribacillus composti]MED0744930.1 RNA-binding cell elongation regulator Jag/EloR [Aeribacillus composti]